MKENKTNWWMIVGIVVIVAVIASLVTMQFTGNAISMTNPDRSACYSECKAVKCADVSISERGSCYKQCSANCRYVDIYTKDEVDALLAGGSGSSECTTIGVSSGTGHLACEIANKTCKWGIKLWSRHNDSDVGIEGPITQVIPIATDCDTSWGFAENQDTEISYLCCD
jgi:hypothetical protein